MESGDTVYCVVVGAKLITVEQATFIRSFLLPGGKTEAVYVEFEDCLHLDGDDHIHGLFSGENVFETRKEAEKAASQMPCAFRDYVKG